MRSLIDLYELPVDIIGEANGVKAGIALIRQHPELDIAFVDVEMEDGTGLDLARIICKEVDFALIFCTAYQHYALTALKLSAVDYLLKPVDPDELTAAIKKAEERNELQAIIRLQKQVEIMDDNLNGDRQRIVLADSKHMEVVNIEDIEMCRSDGNYTKVFLKDQRTLTVSRNIKQFEDALPGHRFFRVHKSYLVNLYSVIRIDRSGTSVTLQGDLQAMVSVRKRAAFIAAVERL